MNSRSFKNRLLILVSAIALATGAFALLFASCAKKPEEAARKAVLTEFTGSCRIERGEETMEGAKELELKTNDVIIVGENGSAGVKVDDDKFLYIDGPASVQLVVNGTADSSQTIVYVENGAVMTEVKNKLSDSSSFHIMTENTVLTIRGTITMTEVRLIEEGGHLVLTNAVLQGNAELRAVKTENSGAKKVCKAEDLSAAKARAFSVEQMPDLAERMRPENREKTLQDIIKELEQQYHALTPSPAPEELGIIPGDVEFRESFLNKAGQIVASNPQAADSISTLREHQNRLPDNLDLVGKDPNQEPVPIIEEEQEQENVPEQKEEVAKQEEPDKQENPFDQNLNPEPQPGQQEEVKPAPEPADNTDPCANGHDIIHHVAKAATCESAGWNEYDTCSRCTYSTYAEIGALGHDYGAWVVTTEPYPEFDDEHILIACHAGTRTKTCSRCPAKIEEPVLITPVLMSEFDSGLQFPLSFFSEFDQDYYGADPMLKDILDPFFWAASPIYDGDFVNIEAVVTFAGGDKHLSELNLGNGSTIQATVTVTGAYRETYADTIATITFVAGE